MEDRRYPQYSADESDALTRSCGHIGVVSAFRRDR